MRGERVLVTVIDSVVNHAESDDKTQVRTRKPSRCSARRHVLWRELHFCIEGETGYPAHALLYDLFQMRFGRHLVTQLKIL
jgi:hypothetical protein